MVFQGNGQQAAAALRREVTRKDRDGSKCDASILLFRCSNHASFPAVRYPRRCGLALFAALPGHRLVWTDSLDGATPWISSSPKIN
jgi:hypothetical protein